jgi:hypothetical protein
MHFPESSRRVFVSPLKQAQRRRMRRMVGIVELSARE